MDFFSKGCPQAAQHDSTNRESLFPYLDFSKLTPNERILLESQLLEDTKKMIRLFASTEKKLIASLISQKVNVSELRNYVANFVSKLGTKAEELERLQRSENLHDVFFALKPCQSFFHHEIIASIVEEFGSDNDHQLMADYISSFTKFCERSVFEVPPNIFHDSDPIPGDKVFAVKFTKEQRTSLGDVVAVRKQLADILGIKVFALKLCCVSEGCVCLRFLVSAQIADKIFPLTESQICALSDNHIELLDDPIIETKELSR